jgi:acyl phosphate:glycerol-3-phosphate acyltransferase
MTGSSLLSLAVPCGAYLLGGVPFGLLVGKLAGGGDVRRMGSGNIGATNVARSVGPAAGVLTLLLDVSKGAIAAWAGWSVRGSINDACVAGFCAVLGHVFPVYLSFWGGKGVATALGAFLVLDPRATLGAGLVFAVVVGAGRRVSLGSIVACVALPVLLHLRGAAPAVLATAWSCSLLILIRHRENLRRLVAGTEPRLGAGKP